MLTPRMKQFLSLLFGDVKNTSPWHEHQPQGMEFLCEEVHYFFVPEKQARLKREQKKSLPFFAGKILK